MLWSQVGTQDIHTGRWKSNITFYIVHFKNYFVQVVNYHKVHYNGVD